MTLMQSATADAIGCRRAIPTGQRTACMGGEERERSAGCSNEANVGTFPDVARPSALPASQVAVLLALRHRESRNLCFLRRAQQWMVHSRRLMSGRGTAPTATLRAAVAATQASCRELTSSRRGGTA